MSPGRFGAIAAVVMMAVLAACSGGSEPTEPMIANPAAVFCEEQGGTTQGPEPLCALPDGTVADAWELYRANAERGGSPIQPAADFCRAQGGVASGPEPLCELPDGTVVDAWEYYRTETATGGTATP